MVPQINLKKFRAAVVDIVLFKNYFVIGTDDSCFHFITRSLTSLVKSVLVSNLPMKLFTSRIKSIITGLDSIIILTYLGDIIRVKLDETKEEKENQKKLNLKEKKIKSIPIFKGNLTAMCLLEKEEQKMIFVASDLGYVYGFSDENHDVIDIWKCNNSGYENEEVECISAIDGIVFEDSHPIFVIGTASGKIYLRKEWAESPECVDIGEGILDLKISQLSEYLIVCTQASKIYLYRQKRGEFISRDRLVINMEKEIPLGCNFSDDLTKIIVTTQLRRNIKISLSNTENRKVMGENKNDNDGEKNFLNASLLDLKFSRSKSHISYDKVIMGQEILYILTGDAKGNLIIWKDENKVKDNCGIFIPGHKSRISDIMVSFNQRTVFTSGQSDHSLIEWEVDINQLGMDDKIGYNSYDNYDSYDNEKNIRDKKGSAAPYPPPSRSPSPSPNFEEERIIKKELEYCKYLIQTKFNKMINFARFRGSSIKTLNSLYQKEDLAFNEDQFVKKRPPGINLELEHVYGIEV